MSIRYGHGGLSEMDRTSFSTCHLVHILPHSRQEECYTQQSSTYATCAQKMQPETTYVLSRKPSSATVDMMQTIQDDFAACRSLMHDIQSRIWHLERRTNVTGTTTVRYKASREGDWQSQNEDTNIDYHQDGAWKDSAHPRVKSIDFLGLPRRFSSFRFDFDDLTEYRKISPVLTGIADVPALSPTSERRARSTSEAKGRPRYSVFPSSTKHDRMFEMRRAYARLETQPQDQTADKRSWKLSDLSASTRTTRPVVSRTSDDIIEQIVDVNLMARPKPAFLESPPLRRIRRTSPSSESLGDDITALPAMPSRPTPPQPNGHHRRPSKALRRLLSSRVSMKKSACAQ